MKIIKNKYIPIKDFIAMTIYPFIFINKKNYAEYEYSTFKNVILNHEYIHARQQKYSMLLGLFIMLSLNYIFNISILSIFIGTIGMFYILYVLNYVYNIIIKRSKYPYEDIIFERETYNNQYNLDYLKETTILNIFKYLKK